MSSGPAALEIIALLIAGVVLILGIVGLVLFIVGMVRKRVGMWVTGLVMGVAVVLLLVVLLGAALFVAPRRAVRVACAPASRMFTLPAPSDDPAPIEANKPGDSNSRPAP